MQWINPIFGFNHSQVKQKPPTMYTAHTNHDAVPARYTEITHPLSKRVLIGRRIRFHTWTVSGESQGVLVSARRSCSVIFILEQQHTCRHVGEIAEDGLGISRDSQNMCVCRQWRQRTQSRTDTEQAEMPLLYPIEMLLLTPIEMLPLNPY